MSADRSFYRWHVGVPLLLAGVLFAVFEFTALDRLISDWFFDPVSQTFALRRQPFLELVLHRGGKYSIVLVVLAALVVFGLSWRIRAWRRWRAPAAYVVAAIVLGTGTVAGLKAVTNKHCPYDLRDYGGVAPYVRLLETAPATGRPGACFPGGHASGGFSLMAFYFVWYRRRPRWARVALVAAFAYGFLLGFGRVMQGAHFVSHNLWAAVVCWFVALMLYRVMLFRSDHRLGS